MVEKRWLDPEPVDVPDALQRAVGGQRLVAQVLIRRGITDPARARAFLDPDRYTPAPPAALPDLECAVARLERAIAEDERIWVWGDFDVDGQTATAVLYEGLCELGARVHYYIPTRFESHGVHLPALERILAHGAQLIVTCDTGITAHAEIAYCRECGVDVIVTDHHDLPEALPVALAIVNPKRLPEEHPLRELTGVGTAFKVMEALYAQSGAPERAEVALDLVALGLVGDVAKLVGDARYLVQRGLHALRRTERPGLRAIYEFAQLQALGLTEEHISYVLAPRLNALGRLDDATPAVELLTTQDIAQARTIAATLEALNDERKLLVKQVLDAAEAQIARDRSLAHESVLVLAHPGWPGGIIGIVAGRLAERYGRPVVLVSIGDDGSARGSARSVPGCDIHAAIAAQRHLLHRYGGHPMAAGFSIAAERLSEFRDGLNRTVAQMMAATPYVPEVRIDAYVNLAEVNMDLAADLDRLAPFGPGNPPPTLVARNVAITSQAVIGRTEEHRRLIIEDEAGESRIVLQWHGADTPLPHGRFDLAFTLRASDFQGVPEVQLEWLDARELEPEVVVEGRPEVAVVDYRRISNPESVLRGVLAGEDAQVWAEGLLSGPPGARDRRRLANASALVVWTIPPGPEEWRAALEAVSPERVYLFAQDPNLDTPAAFLRRLAGLVKHALADGKGQVRIVELAGATAQRETVVRAGLRWLAAKGQIAIVKEDDTWQLARGDGKATLDVAKLEALLRELLQETAAYRSYYLHADADALVRGVADEAAP